MSDVDWYNCGKKGHKAADWWGKGGGKGKGIYNMEGRWSWDHYHHHEEPHIKELGDLDMELASLEKDRVHTEDTREVEGDGSADQTHLDIEKEKGFQKYDFSMILDGRPNPQVGDLHGRQNSRP